MQNGRLERWLRWVNCGTKYFTSHAALGEKTPNLDCAERYLGTCVPALWLEFLIVAAISHPEITKDDIRSS